MRGAVLLDLDGTLTDPRTGIVRCIRDALERLDRPCPPDAALAAYIGPPLRGTFGALLATADPALIERAMSLYRERFAETFHDNGPTDMVAAMRAYRDIGFTGPLRPDHVPQLVGEEFGPPGYTMLGRLFAFGYIRGLMQAVGVT